MRPSKNAFLGYSYQQCITLLMLAKMDAEREIHGIEIESTVDNNFDDIKLLMGNTSIYCQIKDFGNICHNDLVIKGNHIAINGKKHKLSESLNLLFFKDIDIACNAHILGFQSYKTSNVYIIPLSRNEAGTILNDLYKHNEKRESIIKRFFDICLDERRLSIKQDELPTIDIYNMRLLEKTIDVGKKLLENDDILFIEGKPGIGKSHLVTCLAKEYEYSLVYRFWVSSQDKDKDERLIFSNFLANISKELFHDYRYRTEDEIIKYLHSTKRTVIIDGLDYIENYQKNELKYFINFIDKLKGKCTTIVLSRPLTAEIKWTKQQLVNWNYEETKTVLQELYHITDYSTCKNIFDITDGYPILVRFVTEHYKAYNEIPLSQKLQSIDEYYQEITSNANTISVLSLFLTSHSFIMESEISLFLEDEYANIVKEFIKSYPYLFEIRLNRISLFHDSLNTFLRNRNINYSTRSSKAKLIVHKSLMNGEKRFMSRFALFDLDKSMKLEIIKKYASMAYFQDLTKDCIDFEAVRVFYKQIRETLPELEANELEIINYYDLSLIINITIRDHVSTLNEFLYTYVKCLLFHGYGDDDITSSEHLFCMYYYYKTDDATLLYNLTTDEHYDTTHFHQKLEYDVSKEENYFERHQETFKKTKQLKAFLSQEPMFDSFDYIPHILANLYLQKTRVKELKRLQNAIKTYLDEDEYSGISLLKEALSQFKNVTVHSAPTFLAKAKDVILSLGKDLLPNEYHTANLKELILGNSRQGSFSVWPKVLNYIRLSVYEKRKIDISSIGIFFAMYNNRKDYTVWNIDEALKAFEDKGLISADKSIDLIVFTQSMSEKGIRGLLTHYIELHTPDIILSVLKKYHPDRLQITWFDLSPEFINHFSNRLFDYALNSQLLHWHSHSREIDFKDIQNVFASKRKEDLVENLKFLKYRIRIPENHPAIKELQKLGCFLSIHTPDKENKYYQTPEQRYVQGYLDSDSIDFIKEKKLKVTEIAGYTDRNRSVFADLDIFTVYDKGHVKENTLLILRNALIGKIESINMFANIYHFTGNLPKFMNDYEGEVKFENLYGSFMKFVEISLINTEKFDDSCD